MTHGSKLCSVELLQYKSATQQKLNGSTVAKYIKYNEQSIMKVKLRAVLNKFFRFHRCQSTAWQQKNQIPIRGC